MSTTLARMEALAAAITKMDREAGDDADANVHEIAAARIDPDAYAEALVTIPAEDAKEGA